MVVIRGTDNINTQGAQAAPVDWVAQAQHDGTHVSYAKAILQQLGAPMTDVNVYFLVAWMDQEGTSAAWNPLATTVSSGQAGETNFNSVGVKNFPNAAAGVSAWVKTIRNGYYPTILNGIMAGNPLSSVGATNEWHSYTGGGDYAQRIATGESRYLHDPSLANGTVGTSSNASASGSTGAFSSADAGVVAQWGWLINDPEVGPIIRKAESGGYTQDEFQAALQATNWWKTHSSGVRTWEQLLNTDPATARAQLAQQQNAIWSKAEELGIPLDMATMNGLAVQAMEYGWNDQQIAMGVIGAGHVSAQLGGGFGAGIVDTRQLAAQYGITLSDSQASAYETQLAEGLIDQKTLQGNFSKQAEAMFPSIAPQLQAGSTVADVQHPYLNAAAQALGTDPALLNPTDPKWLSPLQAKAPNGAPTTMSLQDWTTKVMSDPTYGWDFSTPGKQAAADLTSAMYGMFGFSGALARPTGMAH